MAKIVGQEDFVYVWTLGVEGMGDGQDKLVTVDVNPASPSYGKVVTALSVGGRHEAHHSASPTTAAISGPPASTPARSSSSTSTPIPRSPAAQDDRGLRLRRGGGAAHALRAAGPHADHRPLQQSRSRRPHRDGRIHQLRQTTSPRTGCRRTTISRVPKKSGTTPTATATTCPGPAAPQRAHDVVVHRLEQLHDGLGQMMADAEAMKRFGNTVVVWDLHARQPKKFSTCPARRWRSAALGAHVTTTASRPRR
jgi:methanethiol oxidase